MLSIAGVLLGSLLTLQSPDPDTVANSLAQKYIAQERFHLKYVLQVEDPVTKDISKPAELEFAADIPGRKAYVVLRTARPDGKEIQDQFLIDGFSLRGWGDGQEATQWDFTPLLQPYLDCHKHFTDILAQIAPQGNIPTSLHSVLPFFRVSISNDHDIDTGLSFGMYGDAAQWLSEIHSSKDVRLKEKQDIWEFELPGGTRISIEKDTGFLRSMEFKKTDGRNRVLTLVEKKMGGSFPEVIPPDPLRSKPLTYEQQQQYVTTRAGLDFVRELGRTKARFEDGAAIARVATALSQWGALTWEGFFKLWLADQSKAQVAKLLERGLTREELLKDREGLADGFTAVFVRRYDEFVKEFGHSVFEVIRTEFREQIRRATGEKDSELEKIVLKALDPAVLSPGIPRLPRQSIREIVLAQLLRQEGK